MVERTTVTTKLKSGNLDIENRQHFKRLILLKMSIETVKFLPGHWWRWQHLCGRVQAYGFVAHSAQFVHWQASFARSNGEAEHRKKGGGNRRQICERERKREKERERERGGGERGGGGVRWTDVECGEGEKGGPFQYSACSYERHKLQKACQGVCTSRCLYILHCSHTTQSNYELLLCASSQFSLSTRGELQIVALIADNKSYCGSFQETWDGLV